MRYNENRLIIFAVVITLLALAVTLQFTQHIGPVMHHPHAPKEALL